jgi:uncharacterized protein (TIGR02453 family)
VPAYFTPALFAFLRELKTHNNREWFLAERGRYLTDVQQPMLRFITDVRPSLRALSPAIVADPRPHGGSLYRIYRDTRFSADKSPYKTNVAAHFAHERKRQVASVPGFYLHLEPGDSMGGGGIYHPDPAALTRIRMAIVKDRQGWAAVKRTGLDIQGDSLTRAPAGFDPAHPFIDDLRMKDFYALTSFSQKEVCAADFLERYVDTCRAAAPLVSFIARALSLRW